MDEQVTIPKSEYDNLLYRCRKLEHLEMFGVDNWGDYGEATSDFEAQEKANEGN